jgi:tetratricopeptide (TPR) repeat protein
MKRDKIIDLFIAGRRILKPHIGWRFIMCFYAPLFLRKKNAIINNIITVVYTNKEYYDEAILILVELLKSENRINDIIYFYNHAIINLKKKHDYAKVIVIYKNLLEILNNNRNIYVSDLDVPNLLAKYNIEIGEILADNYEIEEAIDYLGEAKQIFFTMNSISGIETVNIKLSNYHILLRNYTEALCILEETIQKKPQYNFNKKDLKIFMLYIILILANETTYHNARNHLEDLKRAYISIYECNEYVFILNMISAVENGDIDHFTHEVRSSELSNDMIYKQLFTDIHRNIVRNSRRTVHIGSLIGQNLPS